MCTVSWLRDRSGYQLFCNRDEKLTRAQELPPAVHTRHGVRYLAPIDGDRGGTWLAANELGVTLCVLNGRGTPPIGAPLVSRGILIPELIAASSALEAVRRAGTVSLEPYAPFVLVAVEQQFPACLLFWDGRYKATITNGDAFTPLASSSLDPSGASEHRRALLRKLQCARGSVDAALLRDFHASHGEGASAFSPCMHRADAETVSFTHVKVSGSSVQLVYTPSAPCLHAPGLTLSLTRKHAV
jgi:hypothetical protein